MDFYFYRDVHRVTWGGAVWLGHIVHNTVYGRFQKQILWVSDKHVDLDFIRIYSGYISLKIQCYEKIPVISGSDIVHRFYCDNPPQAHIHTQFVFGKI